MRKVTTVSLDAKSHGQLMALRYETRAADPSGAASLTVGAEGSEALLAEDLCRALVPPYPTSV
eukprot:98196-Rhodomonas_salina.1